VSHSKKSFQYGEHTVTIETGELARQADGAVLVTMSDTVVLVTAVGLKKPTPAATSFRSQSITGKNLRRSRTRGLLQT